MRLLRRGSVLSRKTREVGLLYTAQLALKRLIPVFLFNANKLFVVSTDIRPWKHYQTGDPEFRWAGPEDIDKMLATGEPAASVRKNFEGGARLAVIERSGRIVAYFWCQTNSVDHIDWLRYRLLPTDVWVVFAWIAAELRGQGMHARISNLVFAEFARGGYTRCLSVVDALNRNVIRAGAKGDASLVGQIWFVRVFGLTFVRIDRAVRIGWWGLGRRLTLSMSNLGGSPVK